MDELQRFMDEVKIHNVDNYIDYLEKIIPKAFEQQFKARQTIRNEWEGLKLTGKIFILLSKLGNCDRSCEVFHFLMRLLIDEPSLQAGYRRISSTLARSVPAAISFLVDGDDVVLRQGQRAFESKPCECRSLDHFREACLYTYHTGVVNRSGEVPTDPVFKWYMPPLKHSQHWRFAYAARKLNEHIRDELDNPNMGFEGTLEKLRQVLFWLSYKAWSEVRATVYLTAGAVLPLELTESLFELTLAAEGIPMQPCWRCLGRERARGGEDWMGLDAVCTHEGDRSVTPNPFY